MTDEELTDQKEREVNIFMRYIEAVAPEIEPEHLTRIEEHVDLFYATCRDIGVIHQRDFTMDRMLTRLGNGKS